jgi:hypothetical protein
MISRIGWQAASARARFSTFSAPLLQTLHLSAVPHFAE